MLCQHDANKCQYNSCFKKTGFKENYHIFSIVPVISEADYRRCSVKKVFLKISQNSQENTCARVSFLIKLQAFSCEFCKIFKSNLFYRTPPVAASVILNLLCKKITISKKQLHSKYRCGSQKGFRVYNFFRLFSQTFRNL